MRSEKWEVRHEKELRVVSVGNCLPKRMLTSSFDCSVCTDDVNGSSKLTPIKTQVRLWRQTRPEREKLANGGQEIKYPSWPPPQSWLSPSLILVLSFAWIGFSTNHNAWSLLTSLSTSILSQVNLSFSFLDLRSQLYVLYLHYHIVIWTSQS